MSSASGRGFSVGMGGALLLFIIPTDFNKGVFLLDWKTAVKIPWDVILLFGGGLCLAEGFQVTGLTKYIANLLVDLRGMRLKSIQLKIALSAGACLLASAAALVAYGLVSSRNTQEFVTARVGKLLEAQAKHNLGAVAQVQAATIQSALQENLDTARTMRLRCFGRDQTSVFRVRDHEFTPADIEQPF